ncbi:MAG: hypothetical protein KDA79_15735 [Planctomycetaceae bacterium]|nr:hypothetical protein [Planctomycetaceae bacterium]
MAVWDRRFQERNRPQQTEEAGWWNQEAPWWFPVSLIVFMLSIAYWLSQKELKRREQSRMAAAAAPLRSASADSDTFHKPTGEVEQLRRDAWTVAAMIAEDADREQIFAKVDEFNVTPSQVPEFLMALKLSMMTLPNPWYRPDIPELVEEVCQRVAGEGSERPDL